MTESKENEINSKHRKTKCNGHFLHAGCLFSTRRITSPHLYRYFSNSFPTIPSLTLAASPAVPFCHTSHCSSIHYLRRYQYFSEITPFICYVLAGIPIPLSLVAILMIDLGTDLVSTDIWKCQVLRNAVGFHSTSEMPLEVLATLFSGQLYHLPMRFLKRTSCKDLLEIPSTTDWSTSGEDLSWKIV